MARRDINGLWLMGAGVLFLLWPFNIWLNDLPLMPAILLMAMTMTYFGFQLPKEGADEDEEEERDGPTDVPGDDGGDDDDGPAPWVKEAIAAREAERSASADEDHGEEGSEEEKEEGSEEKEEDGPSPDDDGPTTE